MTFLVSWGKQTRPVQQAFTHLQVLSHPVIPIHSAHLALCCWCIHPGGCLMSDSRQNLQVQMVRWKFFLCNTNFSPAVKAGRCFAGATFNRVFILLTFIYLHTVRSVFHTTNATSSATVNVRPWWGQDDGHRGAWKWLSLNNLMTCFWTTAVPPFSVFQSQLWQSMILSTHKPSSQEIPVLSAKSGAEKFDRRLQCFEAFAQVSVMNTSCLNRFPSLCPLLLILRCAYGSFDTLQRSKWKSQCLSFPGCHVQRNCSCQWLQQAPMTKTAVQEYTVCKSLWICWGFKGLALVGGMCASFSGCGAWNRTRAMNPSVRGEVHTAMLFSILLFHKKLAKAWIISVCAWMQHDTMSQIVWACWQNQSVGDIFAYQKLCHLWIRWRQTGTTQPISRDWKTWNILYCATISEDQSCRLQI